MASAAERRTYQRQRERRRRVREDITRRLVKHVNAKRAAREGKQTGDGSELFGDWEVYLPRASWLAYSLLDATGWQHLPASGGFFEQDELLMEDLTTLTRMASYVDAQAEVNEALGDTQHG